MALSAGIALTISIVSISVAILAYKSSEKSRIHKLLVDLLFEYRSVEMLQAIRTLWDFYRDNKNRLVEAYAETKKNEEKEISNLEPERKIEREKSTLHHQRRIVSKFYSLLAGIYELKIITPEIIYTYWDKNDLEIIPKVILPIEKYLLEKYATHKIENRVLLERIEKLYSDCPIKKSEQQEIEEQPLKKVDICKRSFFEFKDNFIKLVRELRKK